MNERQILKEMAKLLNVSENDIPRTLERFRKEVEEMEKELR